MDGTTSVRENQPPRQTTTLRREDRCHLPGPPVDRIERCRIDLQEWPCPTVRARRRS